MIRVLVVDDHMVVRAGLVSLLSASSEIDVVGDAADGQAAVDAYIAAEPDVVLMDLSMPGMDGIEATARIRQMNPAAHVLVLTSFSDRKRVADALGAGASGYVLKDADPSAIVDAIRAVAQGASPMDPRVVTALLQDRRTTSVSDLTARELEVLRLVTKGCINKQIASELGISEKTVKAHLGRVFQRLGVSDRTQAALWAERHGILENNEVIDIRDSARQTVG